MSQGELRIEYEPLSDLSRALREDNPKDHDGEGISESIRRFGFNAPPTRNEADGKLVAGHGRVEQLVAMHASHQSLPANLRAGADGEWLVPVLRGVSFENDDEARAYLLTDNALTIASGWHEMKLAPILERLREQRLPLDRLGWSNRQVEAILERAREEKAGTNRGGENDERFLLFPRDRVEEEAFRYFRETGFPYRKLALHEQLQELNALAALPQSEALTSRLGYQVADTYHPHRFHAAAANMKAPTDSFADDDKLRRSIRVHLDRFPRVPAGFFGMLSLVAGTQACANFRPGFAMYLYRRFAESGATVLDPCTGYGGRLVGWVASLLGGRYVGVDPNKPTHEANEKLAHMLGVSSRVELHQAPFEDVDLSKLDGKVGLVFTSPPYFSKERYSDDPSQSWQRYGDIGAWNEGFLRPLLVKGHKALAAGGTCVINIADVKIAGKDYPLEQLTREAAKSAGFEQVDELHFAMAPRVGRHDEDERIVEEPVFVFRKPVRKRR